MPAFRRLLLGPSIILLFISCGTPRNCTRIADLPDSLHFPVLPVPVEKPVLYQAEFNVLKYKFSGLIAFRRMNNDEIRIVFLSEAGPKIMEFVFKDGKSHNTYCMEALQRKSLLKFIGHFIDLLLENPPEKHVCQSTDNKEIIYFYRSGRQRCQVTTLNGEITYAGFRKNRRTRAEGTYEDLSDLPSTIEIHMKYHTDIQLKLIRHAFK